MQSLKKNLTKLCKNNPKHRLFFFDESRFGTHSKLGHGWFPKGVRTQVSVKLGFKNFYLYSAVCPLSGEDVSMILPNVNTNCMNAFLQHMSQQLGEEKAILVVDCAGWHRSKTLVVPSNIMLVYLPPYSPELNPVERLWQHIKNKLIKNKVYATLEALEKAVEALFKTLTPNLLCSLCSISYL